MSVTGAEWRPLFSNCRMALIGGLMLDEYSRGHIERISPETPVPVLSVTGRDKRLRDRRA